MKSNIGQIVLTASFFIMTAFSQTGSGSLKLIVNGLSDAEGMLMIALCNSEEDFASTTTAYRSAKVKAVKGQIIYSFTDLPFGTYAIKLFHDRNGNGRLDTNFMGIPRESYGFSNNPRIRFGAPSFSECRFIYSTNNQKVTIDLK